MDRLAGCRPALSGPACGSRSRISGQPKTRAGSSNAGSGRAGYSQRLLLQRHHLHLQGQEKMSKSDPNSAIFMEDTEQEVKTKIKKAFCPPQQVGCVELVGRMHWPAWNLKCPSNLPCTGSPTSHPTRLRPGAAGHGQPLPVVRAAHCAALVREVRGGAERGQRRQQVRICWVGGCGWEYGGNKWGSEARRGGKNWGWCGAARRARLVKRGMLPVVHGDLGR